MNHSSIDRPKKIVTFLGPPGSGKGSLSALCTDNLGLVQLSTGNLCRKHIAQKTEIGIQIDASIKAGKLIDDSLVIRMVNGWLQERMADAVNIILDGYPRTIAQAEALRTLVAGKLPGFELKVVRFLISDAAVITRLSHRIVCEDNDCQAVYTDVSSSILAPKRPMICNKCSSKLVVRSDDQVASITERLKNYYKHEQGLIDYYVQSSVSIHHVEVEKPLEDVFTELKKLMRL